MQSNEEARLVLQFAEAYTASRDGHIKGNLTPAQHVRCIDIMGAAFRDYLVLQQTNVAAQMAIEKAKGLNVKPA